MKRTTLLPLGALALVLAAACSESGEGPAAPAVTPRLSSGVSTGGIVPRLVAGNIAGEGADVCADARVNPTGAAWLGLKVDPPVSGSQNGITYTLSGASSEFLAWSAIASVQVHAVVVKGGSDTHVYDYNPPPAQSDAGLHSPLNNGGNVPAVSHFVFCYTEISADEGCTPGYWKNRALTTGDWAVAGHDPDHPLSGVFTFPAGPAAVSSLGGASLLDALSFQGGKGAGGAAQILLRAATAALLNAAHPDVDYPLDAAGVVAQVNAALVQGSDSEAQWRARMLALAATLDQHNNAGCPLGAPRD